MSEWMIYLDYSDVWQCYSHLPVQQMTAADVMATVTPGSGETWRSELHHLWTADQHDTLILLQDVARAGISEPIIIGPDGRLWDGHHRVAVALALNITVPARIVPDEKCIDPRYEPPKPEAGHCDAQRPPYEGRRPLAPSPVWGKPMTRLGQSPPPMCLCGHPFHTGPCEFIGECDGCDKHLCYCHCPDGELDGDR